MLADQMIPVAPGVSLASLCRSCMMLSLNSSPKGDTRVSECSIERAQAAETDPDSIDFPRVIEGS